MNLLNVSKSIRPVGWVWLLTMFAFSVSGETAEQVSLNGDWLLKSSEHLAETGEQISAASYAPSGWMPARVPGTTLGAYVANHVYPEPTYDRNNQLGGSIPDISVPGSVFTFPHWWRTTFTVPASWHGRKLWLNLDGVNWSAEIFVNGKGAGSMKGAFKRGIFDISALATTGTNALAVRIVPPPFPGLPKNIGCGGQDGGNRIGQTPATINQTVGWDFTFVDGVRDRNTGVYREVFLTTTGPVRIADPFMRTVGVPGESGTLAFRTWLVNSSDRPQKGILSLAFEGATASAEVELAAKETREVAVESPRCPGLVVKNPRLWWPNGRGRPELYDLTVSFHIDGTISDMAKTRFGIRSIQHETSFHGQNTWKVNGKRLFMPGGCWVQDALLRQTPKRYDAELRMIAQAGLTWLRIWSGSGIESDEFFAACDRYGILVWVEAGLTTGQTPVPSGKPDFPAFKKCISDNWTDTVLRLRNHPSVFYWCGSNEGPDLEGMKEIVAANDGSRDYQSNSQDFGQAGSIYTFQGIASLYDYMGRGPWFGGLLGIFAGFCNESSNPNLPNVECLREQMPEAKLWPIDEATFKYQDGGGFHNILGFIQQGCSRYGSFTIADMAGRIGADNYSFKGQILGAMQYRADSELWQRNKWNATGKRATGYAMWTANTTHPQVVSRLYHYSLEPNAALWYMAHGNKALHAQYDYFANDISVVNNSWNDAAGLTVRADIRNLDWSLKWSGSAPVSSLPEETTRNGLMMVPGKETAGLDDVHFIDVELKDAKGHTVDEMIYWRSRCDTNYGCDGSFAALNTMPPATLNVETSVQARGGRQGITATLTNPGKGLAFFIRLKLQGSKTKRLIRPAFYSENGFSIRPGQRKTVTIDVADEDMAGEKPMLGVEGWNVGIVAVAVPGKLTTPVLSPLAMVETCKQGPPPPRQDLAKGQPIKVSSERRGDWAVIKEVADFPNTCWVSEGGDAPQWLQIDLGSAKQIGSVQIHWKICFAKAFQVQISNDGNTWKDAYSTNSGAGNIEEIAFPPVNTRYVRLLCTRHGYGNGYWLHGFRVFGASAE